MEDINQIKEGDLVEILLKPNANWVEGWQGPDYIDADSDDHLNEPNRYLVGYATVPEDDSYISLRPTWNKEKSKPVFPFLVGGLRIYKEAIESFSKK